MSVVARLQRTRRTFLISIVSLAVCSVLALGAMLYAANVIRFHHTVSMEELRSLTNQYPDVADYLTEQKAAEAHFVKIANLVQAEQQQLLGRVLLLSLIPILLLGGIAGYLLARRLLRPVEESVISQERFVQDAAHEIRNPLAAATAVIQQARDPRTSQPERLKALSTLERQMQQLVKLNEDLLLLERIREPYVGAPINVSDVLGEVVDGIRPTAVSAKVRIKENAKEGVIAAIGEQDFVSLARNLLDNAIKYSSPGGVVTVGLQSDGNTVVLKVRDEGIGVPSAEQSQIGNRFYRAANVGRREGTGLGLAIVEKVLQQYHGTLELQSRQGRGTTAIATFRSGKR